MMMEQKKVKKVKITSTARKATNRIKKKISVHPRLATGPWNVPLALWACRRSACIAYKTWFTTSHVFLRMTNLSFTKTKKPKLKRALPVEVRRVRAVRNSNPWRTLDFPAFNRTERRKRSPQSDDVIGTPRKEKKAQKITQSTRTQPSERQDNKRLTDSSMATENKITMITTKGQPSGNPWRGRQLTAQHQPHGSQGSLHWLYKKKNFAKEYRKTLKNLIDSRLYSKKRHNALNDGKKRDPCARIS